VSLFHFYIILFYPHWHATLLQPKFGAGFGAGVFVPNPGYFAFNCAQKKR
jgi:hypothetical protein